ncbi:short-chain fatty acids transporter [Luminiphilus syltensis NOR5-1B]|uniref:Short-chain fatty acids transporter n=1 Tax=Luminiphilus syltensis NOR5-1B TaxID=565045 RepID=B8KT67_9GAMM|nr:TIGR00366 family protein [Luminiphilus syltensis]EED36741.1 short-chain fatty acids transporter [Luminiphilus syltensis NOR5-1B]
MDRVRHLQEWIERHTPDPLVFAISLTVFIGVVAVTTTSVHPLDLLNGWGDSLHTLLAFSMQMALIIVTAYVLAHTALVRRGLLKVAGLAITSTRAYVLVILTSAFFSLLAWPLGLIAGGLLAREVARNAVDIKLAIHYPLLVAAAFGGFVVWEMGYSSSIGLSVATPGNPLEADIGRLIPIGETLLTDWNLLTILSTLLVVTLTVLVLHRLLGVHKPVVPEGLTFTPENAAKAAPVEGKRWQSVLLGILLASYVFFWFWEKGANLDLNVVNWTFLALGLLLVRSLQDYSSLFSEGARVAAPVLLQYPFYAGIMGIAVQSGLAESLTATVISVASAESLPVLAFFSAGLINLFIPSGGAQWAIQGPTFIQAANILDVDRGLITMSVAYGDQWTNLIQPFCAVPLLAVSGLQLRHIYGFSILICILSAFPLITGLMMGSALG